MFTDSDPRRRVNIDPQDDVDRDNAILKSVGLSSNSIVNFLYKFGPSIDAAMPSLPLTKVTQDWSGLVDQIRAAACHVRDVEAQAREREEQVEALLERVRDDIRAADERIRAAEARASDTQSRAAEQVRAAEARAEAAEARARDSEEWLKRIHEIIVSEFTHSLPDRTAF